MDDYHGLRHHLRLLLQRSGLSHGDKPEVVGQLMTATPIIDLLPLMAALYQSRFAELAA